MVTDVVLEVNDINWTSTDAALKDGLFTLKFCFETDGAEIVADVSSPFVPEWFVPDINAENLSLEASMRLGFDRPSGQLTLLDPAVTFKADWLLNLIVVPDVVKDAILNDGAMNAVIEQQTLPHARSLGKWFSEQLTDQTKRVINEQLPNSKIVDAFGKGDQIILVIEQEVTYRKVGS